MNIIFFIECALTFFVGVLFLIFRNKIVNLQVCFNRRTMKRIVAFLCSILLTVSAFAAERDTIVFNGDTLPHNIGDTLFFDQTLYVCARTSSYYLYLSYERLREPEEVAQKGTAAYDSALTKFQNAILKVYCPYFKQKDTIRLGAIVRNLVAFKAGERYVKTYASEIEIDNNTRPTSRPDVGEASLIVCAANVEHYCPDWEGSLSSAQSDTDYQRQHLKLMKALVNIDADIYALTELQPGIKALNNITNALNEMTQPGLYAFVDDKDSTIVKNVKVAFIYRTDKVVPVLGLGFPYGTTYQELTYHNREYVQAFDELATGERFVLSMNHFKAGAGDSTTMNSRMANVKHLVDFIDQRLKSNYYHDKDVMIVGDLNSFMQEPPIIYLDDSGFDNMLTKFAQKEYSYAFDKKVEYLDYVFTTPSMSAQVTGAQPYHINADESEIYYYANGEDTTMYRYADHDPIIIGLKLYTPAAPQAEDTGCTNIIFFEPFRECFGEFYPVSASGSESWLWSSDDSCAYMNGYFSHEQEDDWLVSPYFNLAGVDSAWFSFEHSIGYGIDTLWPQRCRLFVSSDYKDDPAAASWTEFPLKMAAAWEWIADTVVVPAQFFGFDSVVVAFNYNNFADEDIPVWSIRNFAFGSICSEEPEPIIPVNPKVDDFKENDVLIYSIDKQIVIKSDFSADLSVFDLSGREVLRRSAVSNSSFSVPPGFYIVRFGSTATKVFVY